MTDPIAKKPSTSSKKRFVSRFSEKKKILIYLLLAFSAGIFLSILLFFFGGIYILQTLALMEETLHDVPWNLPTRVYAQPLEIAVGSVLHRTELISCLSRLGYFPAASVHASGEYNWDEKGLDLYLLDASTPDGVVRGFPVRVELSNEMVVGIWNSETGKHLSSVTLEPELLGSIYDPSVEDRRPIPLNEVPQTFIDCLLVSEDKSYFEHHGVDPTGILRALWVNLKEQRLAQGGSTITQQLVRNLFLTRNKTIRRKLDEALMAILLEITRTKEQILELYINECYLGQAGGVSVGGLRQGARYYFGTEPRFLQPEQCAMLVAILRGPNYYNPFKYPERVKQRRDTILAHAAQEGKLSSDAQDQAINVPLPQAPHSLSGSAPFVVDAVSRSLADQFDPAELQTKGYSVFTSIDARLQTAAEKAVQTGLQELENRYPQLARSDQPLQAALVSIDPDSGAVRAMIGGRNYEQSQYNRALLTSRPIGSLIKPFLYLCALDGAQRGEYEWRPNSLLNDIPITIQTPSGPWKPENYTKDFIGLVTMRRALEHSINIPAVQLSQKIGIQVFADFLEKIGIPNPPRVPSLVLGTAEMTPYQVASIYTSFLNQGNRFPAFFIRSIVTTDGHRLPLSPFMPTHVSSPLATYQVLSMLQGVFERGTAVGAYEMGWKGIAAGKTGTTDETQDSWFVGMTPDLITAVWVGYDQPQSIGLTGSKGALPIWVQYMKEIMPNGNHEPFPIPEGLQKRSVYYHSGELVAESSGRSNDSIIPEYFLPKMVEEELPSQEMPAPVRDETATVVTVKQVPRVDIQTSPLEDNFPKNTPTSFATPEIPANLIHTPTVETSIPLTITPTPKRENPIARFFRKIFSKK